MKTDPNHTFLDKYIRPVTLVYFEVLWTCIMLCDGNVGEFTVKEIYVDGLNAIVLMMIGVYVLGKSAENIFKPKKEQNE